MSLLPPPNTAPVGAEITETVDCPVCGAAETARCAPPEHDTDDYGGHLSPAHTQAAFVLAKCAACGTTYLRQRPRMDEIKHYYAGEYHCFTSFKERGAIFRVLSKLLARSKIKAFEKHFPSQSRTVLDYGCGSGTWIELMIDASVDWTMIGTDLIEEQIERVRDLGVVAYAATDRELLDVVEPGSVSAIHLFHVIEHVPDPVLTLSVLHDVLEPGGVILGQTPNFASWDQSIFGRFWSQRHLPRHLVLFTPDTLSRAARAAGLEVVSVSSAFSTATNWAGSLLKYLSLSRQKKYEPVRSPLYPLLIIGFIPLVVVQSLFSTTGNMDFVLRRPGN